MRVPLSCLVGLILSLFVVPAVLFGQDRDDRDRDSGERGKREYSREQIEGYLKRLDRNESQVLELDEMSDRTKRWLGGLGLDTSRPIKLSTAMRSVDSDKATKAKLEKRKQLEANRLVPGFGVEVDSSTEASTVLDFSGATTIAPGSLEEKYGKSVMQQVDSTLAKYDTNKSGTLNSQEIAAGRWGRPTPQESDANKDGRLSRSELAERYAQRSSGSRSSRSESSKKESSSDSSRSSRSSSSSRESDSRSRGRTSSSRSGGSDLKSRMEKYDSDVKSRYDKSSPEKSSKESDAYNSGSDRYKRYADALLKQYDKDKDNKLSKAEVKTMRRPPGQADSNGDGMITRDELIDSISNPKPSSSSSSGSGEERSSRSSARSRFSDRNRGNSETEKSSSSSRSSSSRVSFSGNDTNKDGQLQMHEFAKDWDSETLKDFKEKDKNNDGIITRSEWTGR